MLNVEQSCSFGVTAYAVHVAGPGAHDLLCISLSEEYGSAKQQPFGSRPLLLPFAKEFVPTIDHDKNSIHICPPSGLLELAFAPKPKEKKGAPDTKKKHSKKAETSEA